jgi:hypothetical protein
MSWRLLADVVAAMHAAYVAFVVLGLIAIIVGYAMGWGWVRNGYFRGAHLAAILLVCAESIFGATCPLTALENLARIRGAQAGYGGDFLGYWIDWLIFYHAPPWVFTMGYLAFGALVLATWWIVPVRWSRRAHPPPGDAALPVRGRAV